MTKKIAVALVSILAAGSLTACGWGGQPEEYDANIDTGVVTKVERVKLSKKYKITVWEDDAEYDSYKVSASVAIKCKVGTRWPNCKK